MKERSMNCFPSRARRAVWPLALIGAGLAGVAPAPHAQEGAAVTFVAADEGAPTLLASAGMPPLHAFGGHDAGFVAAEIGSRSAAKGAPYSAAAVSETTQLLQDGNRIQRRTTTRLARDAEGRTRQERLGRDGSVQTVFIDDVVAGKRYVLFPARKAAHELPAVPAAPLPPPGTVPPVSGAMPEPPPPALSPELSRSWAESMRRWADEFRARWRSERTEAEPTGQQGSRDQEVRVVVNRAASSDGESQAPTTQTVEVVRVFDGAGAWPPPPPLPPLFPPPLPAAVGQGVKTALGNKEFDGVTAAGSRTTWTIAAGRIGNEKPIEIVSERWYSPDLMLVVASRYYDPRSGETTYKLSDLKRGESDPALFKVPSDYEVRKAPPRPGHPRRELRRHE
jgi:hypothetical protein